MKLKTIIVTIAVLAALSVVAFIARRPAPPPAGDSRINQPLIDRATIEKAAKLRLSDQGKTVTLARLADGTWQVPAYYDLPADFPKLSTFVGSLTEAKIERLVTSSAERIARLEFKDTKIELLDNADKELFSLTLGRSPDAGGGRFVRFGNEQKAYQAGLNAFLDTEAKNWANPEVLNLKPDDVAQVEIPFAEGGTVVVSRAKKDQPWTADNPPAGRRVKADRVTAVINSTGNIRFSDTNGLDDPNVAAAKANLRTFKLTTFDNKTVTVAMGRKPEEKKLKPPAASADGKSGPGALGSISDLTKKGEEGKKPDEAKPLAPEYETIPAGPVFVFVTHSDAAAPINAWMQKRAFQIAEYSFTALPQKADELFEPAPAPAPPPTLAPEALKPAPGKASDAK